MVRVLFTSSIPGGKYTGDVSFADGEEKLLPIELAHRLCTTWPKNFQQVFSPEKEMRSTTTKEMRPKRTK